LDLTGIVASHPAEQLVTTWTSGHHILPGLPEQVVTT